MFLKTRFHKTVLTCLQISKANHQRETFVSSRFLIQLYVCPVRLSGLTIYSSRLLFFRFRFWNLFFCRLLCLFRIFRVALLFSYQSSVSLLFISNSDIISHLHKFVNHFFYFLSILFSVFRQLLNLSADCRFL